MTNEIKQMENKPVQNMKNLLANKGMQELFMNTLKENAGAFIASIIDLYGSENSLQTCNPKDVAMEALKAATLKLPINKNLGFAYIVPYKGKPTMTIGYKGLIQLAQRTGHYKSINAGMIFEGMELKHDYLSGTFSIEGRPSSNKVLGYFAYFKMINGFEKALYMSKEEITNYGKKYSQAYNNKFSPWQTEFDEMGQKTVLRRLLSKYGELSTEVQNIIKQEEDDILQEEVKIEAAQIPFNDEVVVVDPGTGEIIENAPF